MNLIREHAGRPRRLALPHRHQTLHIIEGGGRIGTRDGTVARIRDGYTVI